MKIFGRNEKFIFVLIFCDVFFVLHMNFSNVQNVMILSFNFILKIEFVYFTFQNKRFLVYSVLVFLTNHNDVCLQKKFNFSRNNNYIYR